VVHNLHVFTWALSELDYEALHKIVQIFISFLNSNVVFGSLLEIYEIYNDGDHKGSINLDFRIMHNTRRLPWCSISSPSSAGRFEDV